MLYTLVLKQEAKFKKDDTVLRKNTDEKQNCVTTTISAGWKGTVFPVKLKLEGESFE